ncbi:hypothetical protein CDD82_491 [Ophiocordyceps australis]|uniref:Uncharacterized protein n=1 Tax=Ophiocordyceps australis TaxID=1399860 RepID=A0A2C5ZP08_9HYPO|nr:hypothetical protein CDD82_491 [Ophiocordyceps australis]
MGDAFGTIGVIGVAGQIIQATVQFGLDFKDAPTDVKNFIIELQALKTTLSETHSNLITNDEFIQAFKGQDSALLKQTLGIDTSQIILSCKHELEELLQKLTKRTQGHRVGWERLKGAFLSERTRDAVQDVYRQCQTLNSLVAIDTAALMACTLNEVRAGRQEHRDGETSRQQAAVLDWLSSMNHYTQHSEAISPRQPGTGQWFLETAEYQKWVQTTGQTLFSPGIPGSGKTVLTSIVVEDLSQRFKGDDNIGIAYLYCNFKSYRNLKAIDLLASILKQLAQGKASLPNSVQSLFNNCDKGRTRPLNEQVSITMHSVVMEYTRVFIIVDALDELTMSYDCGEKLLSELFALCKDCEINLFATSRFIPGITSKFQDCLWLNIKATDHDVQTYLEAQASSLPIFVSRDSELSKQVVNSIMKATDGMFLLAKLHLDTIKDKLNLKAVRAALKNLAKGSDAYKKAYDDAMERIEHQSKDRDLLAKRVLSWITCAKRPLTVMELQHALAVEINESELDEENITEVEILVTVCAGLVIVEQESSIIRLVHYTTQEYFENTFQRWFPGATSEITRVCLTYLSMRVFEGGPCPDDDMFEERLRLYNLYDYASKHWGSHAYDDPSVTDDGIRFLKGQANVEASCQAFLADLQKWGCSFYRASQWHLKINGIHLAAHFGLEDLLRRILEGCEVDLRDSHGQTPFVWALRQNHGGTLKLLHDRGADINSKDIQNMTPLMHAIEWNLSENIHQILDWGADIDAKDSEGWSSIIHAANWSNKELMRLLIERGADIDVKDCQGRSSIIHAVKWDNMGLIRLLIDRGADINATDNRGLTALHHASFRENIIAMKLLVENGSYLETKSRYDETPLMLASKGGNLQAVRLLMQQGSDVNFQNDNGRTPLHMAALSGYSNVVKFLREMATKRW